MQLLKSRNFHHFAIYGMEMYIKWIYWSEVSAVEEHYHGFWQIYIWIQNMLMLANRFLGLEAEVTQENFYFNATKVTLSQLSPSPSPW